jgi:hypothetical protein
MRRLKFFMFDIKIFVVGFVLVVFVDFIERFLNRRLFDRLFDRRPDRVPPSTSR